MPVILGINTVFMHSTGYLVFTHDSRMMPGIYSGLTHDTWNLLRIYARFPSFTQDLHRIYTGFTQDINIKNLLFTQDLRMEQIADGEWTENDARCKHINCTQRHP